MHLLVGLGNPGPRYVANRHNVGFMALDEVRRRYGFGGVRGRFDGEISEGTVAGEKVLALKPQTYMNESGQSVGQAVRFHKIAPTDVIVLHDEIDLAPGKVRAKRGGGFAGHNGLRSIGAHIGPDFCRVRLGVGHPGKAFVMRHVLHDFDRDDIEWVAKMLEAVAEALPLVIAGDDPGFMSRVALLAPAPKFPPAEDGEDDGDDA